MNSELEKINKIPFVFIVGRGRSGTSLLLDMLGAHPRLVAANESPFILKSFRKYLRVTNWTAELIDHFLNDLYDDLQFAHFWNVDRAQLRANLLQYPSAELTFQLVCKIVYLNASDVEEKANVRWIVDKNPLYSLYMADLKRLFVNSKFIHIIRDYRANIVSCRRSFGETDLALLTNRWVNYHKEIDRYARSHKGEVLQVKYEQLAADPLEEMKKVCAFLEIDYHEKMERFYETNKRDLNVSKEAVRLLGQIHPNLRKPVNTDAVNKWMRELKQEELELIDYIAGGYAATKGYTPTTHAWKWFFGFVSAKKQMQFRLTFGLTRFYYFMPVFLRNVTRSVSTLLYRTLGYKNRFNRTRFTLAKQGVKEKKES